MPRILIVDSDSALVRATERLLVKELDAEVVLAHSELAAVACVEGRDPFDVLVTSWYLPDGCGLEVMMRVHQTHDKLPIILCSETGDKEVLLLAVAAGATDYLLKPYDVNVLVAKVRKALERAPATLYHDERLM